MRLRVEQVLNRALKDREAPSKALVASKLEQLEEGVPKAEDLRDVTSYEDVEGEAYTVPSSILPRLCCASSPAARPQFHRGLQKSFGFAVVASAWLGIS